ncbi:RHS repeat-associated core domain-containing protein [Lautropia mirabilis]|jgi:rhs family protein
MKTPLACNRSPLYAALLAAFSLGLSATSLTSPHSASAAEPTAAKMVEMKSTDAGTSQLFFDEAGRPIREIDATGSRLEIQYDKQGRMIEKRLSDKQGFSETTTYHYKENQLVKVESPSMTERMEYDAHGRLIARTAAIHPVDSGKNQIFVTRFQYDPSNNSRDARPSGIMLPNGAALRVKAYSDGAFDVHAANFQLPAGLDGPLYSNSGNGKNGPQRVAMLASGLMDQLSFDPYGHVTGGATAILASPPSFDSILNQTRIRYDENGRWRLYDTLLQRQFPEYDEQGHLTRVKWQSPDKKELVERLRIGAATVGESQWQYRHDDRGNRIASSWTHQPALQGKSADRKQEASFLPGTHRYQNVPYDAAGRPLEWNGWKLRWHPGGQILSMTHKDGRSIQYSYNHRGERVARREGKQWTFYDYQDGLLHAEIGAQRPLMRSWWHHQGMPLLMIDALKADKTHDARWILVDPRGLPYAALTPHNTLSWSQSFGPFGEVLPDTPYPSALKWQPQALSDAERRMADPALRFPGHWADPTTGLHFTKRGEYDPDTGRYLAPQPDAPKGSNPYLFMNGNPMQALLKPFAPY